LEQSESALDWEHCATNIVLVISGASVKKIK
jgi:hypothetical protein